MLVFLNYELLTYSVKVKRRHKNEINKKLKSKNDAIAKGNVNKRYHSPSSIIF